MAREQPFLGLAAIAAQVATPGREPVSLTTVSRRLHEAGLKTRVSCTKIELSDMHKGNRLLYAQENLENFDQAKWMRTKFSDEKTFRSDMSGKLYVRR